MKLKPGGSQGDLRAGGSLTNMDNADSKKNAAKQNAHKKRGSFGGSTGTDKKSRRSIINGFSSRKEPVDGDSLFPMMSFKAKLVGSEALNEAKNAELAVTSFAVLKKKANSMKGHKTRILINISLKEGVKISTNETKAGKLKLLLQCAANKITYHTIDKDCQRTFGFVVATAELKYQFFAVKMEKSASHVKAAFDDLLAVVARIVESNGVHGQSPTPKWQSERAIDVPLDLQTKSKAHAKLHSQMDEVNDTFLPAIALNNEDSSSHVGNLSNSPNRSSLEVSTTDSQTTYQQNKNRHSGRKLKGAFAKIFGSKRRGTSMIDLSGKEQNGTKGSPVGRKSLQMESARKPIQRSKRVSRSMVNVNSTTPERKSKEGQLKDNTAPADEDKRNKQSEGLEFNVSLDKTSNMVDPIKLDPSQVLTPEPIRSETTAKPIPEKASDMKSVPNQETNVLVPVTVEFQSDPFGAVTSFDEPVSMSGFDSDWASFDYLSSSKDVQSDLLKRSSKFDHVQCKSSPLWFDSTFVSQTTAEMSKSFNQVSSSTPIAIAGKEKELLDLFNLTTETQEKSPEVNNNTSINSYNTTTSNAATLHNVNNTPSVNTTSEDAFGISSTIQQESSYLAEGFGNEDLFASFAFTSEARELSKGFSEISTDRFDMGDFSRSTEQNSESRTIKRGQKAKSAFDLFVDVSDQPNFDVFTNEMDVDSDGGNSSPYEMRPSSAMDRDTSQSAWNFNEDEMKMSLDTANPKSRQFFMRPTSVSGCHSVSNFSSAFAGSQNRLDKPMVKHLEKSEQPFEDDPFFAS